jgi:protein-tyrosine-phosphatase
VAPLLTDQSQQHRSRPLDPQALAWADLVLTAARDHQRGVLATDPAARPRTFTLTQAGRLSQWLLDAGMLDAAVAAGRYPPEDPRSLVAPLPSGDRAQWLVGELDAARGMAPAPPAAPAARRRWWGSAPAVPAHPDDIPDPHELGTQWHEPAAAQITAGLAPLLELLRRLAH